MITRSGGYIACKVGKVRYSKVKLERQVVQVAEYIDIKIGCTLINQNDFTKTPNYYGVINVNLHSSSCSVENHKLNLLAINMSSSCFISFRRLIPLTRLLPFSDSYGKCLRQFFIVAQHFICNPSQIQKNGTIIRWFRVLREKNRCIPFNSVTVVSKFA